MRKGLELFLPAILLLPASCRKAPSSADGKVTIRYLANPDVGGATKVLIKKFEEKNPGIHVEMVEGPSAPNTREDMYATSFMAQEDSYDFAHMDVAWLAKFAAQGWLKPLDGYFAAQEQEKFLPGDIAGSKFNGKIYRVPNQSDGGLLYYRKDLLKARGLTPPRTWDELVAAAKKIQSPPNLWGYVFEGKQYECLVCNFLELAWGNGGELIDEKGQVLIDRPEAVQALQWMVDAVHKHKISPPGVLTYQEEEARHVFQEGQAVFMRNWPYAWELMQKEGSPVKGKVGIVPMVHGKGRSAAALGGWGFGISAFSKHPDEAWKFIEFLTTHEGQKTAYLMSGILPTRKSVYADPEILKASPQIKDLYNILSLTRPRPLSPAYARVSDIVQLKVSAALSGLGEPQKLLSEAAQEIRGVLKR
ncbi:MAG: ABC transporter substrate-binding protein [Elusimicrobia bacterium]|nr:ABC transporter substrate-binding protein [Elusimicrobiota bacterium]